MDLVSFKVKLGDQVAPIAMDASCLQSKL